jgi:hypothetical protein
MTTASSSLRPARPLALAAGLALLLTSLPASAALRTFGEDFNGYPNPTCPCSVGWLTVADTANPTVTSLAFATNDNLNVVKFCTDSDGVAAFADGYLFIEHDIAPGETVLPGNLPGQDAGDVLLLTAKPLAGTGAPTLDLAGASFSVRYQHGDGHNSGAVFWFAIQLADGTRWAMQDPGIGFASTNVHTLTSDPVEPGVTEWNRLASAGGTGGQRLRRLDTPQLLSAGQLASVTAVGLYVYPAAELQPSRFDDFTLGGYDVARPRLGVSLARTNLVLRWTNSFTGFELQASANLASSTNWSQVPAAATVTNGEYRVTVPVESAAGFFRLRHP